jgi:hypothetical protein
MSAELAQPGGQDDRSGPLAQPQSQRLHAGGPHRRGPAARWRWKFSQYVTEAVARRLELDLLAELSEMLTSEHGPVPDEYVAGARASWPGDE